MASEHVVQLFDTDASRAQNVATFAARGLAAGEPVVLVLRPANAAAVVEQLEALGVAARPAIAEGRLILHNAEEMLGSICREGRLDHALFRQNVVAAVRQLANGRRVWGCGEMVDVLTQRGDLRAAILLESWWVELADQMPMMVLCAYSSAHFVSTSTHGALIDICKVHSDVHRDAQDPLGNWLLTAAHNRGGTGSPLQH